MASKLARFSWLPGGLAAALVIAIGRLVAPASFNALELTVYDGVQRAAAAAAPKDIVLVDIDAASLSEFGPWPWPRGVHAQLLQRLHENQVRVVGFTMPFGDSQNANETERVRAALALVEGSNLGKSEQAQQLRALLHASANGIDPDEQLAMAIATHGNVVLPVDVRVGGKVDESATLPTRFSIDAGSPVVTAAQPVSAVRAPLPAFMQAASAVGHSYLPTDVDGVVRSDLTAVRTGRSLIPSLAAAIATRASAEPSEIKFDSPAALHIAQRETPLGAHLTLRPQYLTPTAAGLVHYSYSQVLAGAVPAAQLRDKIVIVGFADPDSTHATAANPASSVSLITASSVAAMLDGAAYSRPTAAVAVEWLAMIGVLLFAAFVLPAAGLGLGALATALVVAILAVIDIGLLGSMNLWIQLMLSCVAALAGFAIYTLGELIRRANVKSSGAVKDPTTNLRMLGQTFQKQGQLDLAFETYRRCPLDAPTMELLYYLGMDFERRRQNQKAAAVYNYIATRDPNYRDLRARRVRVKDEPVARESQPKPKAAPPMPTPRSERRGERNEGRGAERSATKPSGTGRTLGRYEIERELGKGAMGVVYLGRDPKINRVVAIKAIPLADEFDDEDLEEARVRFFREAEMAGRLNHPAIVTVYDAGEDQGLAYIAMEYLRGQHLSHYTNSERLLPPHTVMLLVARTAEALHYAHRQNVVHRDIKPANIMFNPDTDELKITDFGIARLTDTSRTKTGIVLGTPSFMSPEQLEGRSLDGRSDQFALGVSLYQLLCGQLPFRADSMPRLMQKIATEPHTAIRMVRPELPARIEAIIDRTLAKSADDRYVTCAELAADLRECAKSLEPARSATEHEWLLP